MVINEKQNAVTFGGGETFVMTFYDCGFGFF